MHGSVRVPGAGSAWYAKAAAFAGLKLLVVQDILPSPASVAAGFVLPGGAFAEKDGTFVNHAGLAQAIRRAVRCPGEARPDGTLPDGDDEG